MSEETVSGNEQMVTPSGSCPAGSPAAAPLAASENGHYIDCAHEQLFANFASPPEVALGREVAPEAQRAGMTRGVPPSWEQSWRARS